MDGWKATIPKYLCCAFLSVFLVTFSLLFVTFFGLAYF